MPTHEEPSRPQALPGVLDEGALGKLRELDPDGRAGIVVRVLRTYEQSLDKTLAALAQAAGPIELGAIRHHAHTLKSSSASVGALALAALCAQAESLARDARSAELPGVLRSLQEEGHRVSQAVQAILEA